MVRRSAVAAAVAVCALLAAVTSSASSGNCRSVSGTANDAAASPTSPYVGFVDFTIGGVSYPHVLSITTVVAPLVPAGSSGVLFTTTTHTYSSPQLGTITTLDDARLIPTQQPGVYRLETHVVPVTGATGELHLTATVNLATLTASGSYAGSLCGL